MSSPATSAAAARLAKTRPEVAWGLEVILRRILSNQFLVSLIALWSTNQPRLHVANIPIGVATNGCDEWGDTHACCTLWPSFLDSYQLPTPGEPLTPLLRDTPLPGERDSEVILLCVPTDFGQNQHLPRLRQPKHFYA